MQMRFLIARGFVFGVAAGCAVAATTTGVAAQVAPPPATQPAQAADLLAVALDGLDHAIVGFMHGGQNFQTVADWAERVTLVCADADLPRDRRVAALKAHVERMRKFEAAAEERYKAGNAPQIEAIGGRFLRLQAERALAKAERG
jgi:hypothetical protein